MGDWVAVRPQPQPANLLEFFWSEIRMISTRLYEPGDFEGAIQLVGGGHLPIEALITQVRPIEAKQSVIETIDTNRAGMKYVIQWGVSK